MKACFSRSEGATPCFRRFSTSSHYCLGPFLDHGECENSREYERAVVFTLGRFEKDKGPGVVAEPRDSLRAIRFREKRIFTGLENQIWISNDVSMVYPPSNEPNSPAPPIEVFATD